jgi:hypothetical protein
MKPIRLLLALACFAVSSSAAHAQGVVSMTWDGCTGPINKTDLAGVPVQLYVSVLGQAQPHQSYGIDIKVGSPGGLPDAWRFDVAGCQGSGFLEIDHTAPASVVKTCPTFQGGLQSVQVKGFSYDGSTGTARMTMYDAYPNGSPPQGNTTTTNPLQRYFLARFVLDETYGVTGPTNPGVDCGGLEQGLCFFLSTKSWLDLAGHENVWAVERNYVTTNGPVSYSFPYIFNSPDTCDPPVPTRPMTWGAIKHQYR